MDWLEATGPLWFLLLLVTTFFNGRAAFKLLVDWKGMLTTCRFVEDAYAGLDALPDEAALEHAAGAPVFVHLVPAYYEPAIAETLAALLGARYPHHRVHVIVATRAEEEQAPHPLMEATTAELVRRFRDTLPPWQQKMLTLVVAPAGEGRKAHQLNWALRPETLRAVLERGPRPDGRVYVGVSDADSLPDRNTYRWLAADVLAGRARLAYQGVTLSLANFARLDHRGRVCAIQQSSIFIRVSIARLINEARRVAWFARLAARPAAAGPAGAAGVRAALPPLADLSGSPPVRAARYPAGARRLSHRGRHRGFHARLRARRPRHPDGRAAHAGAGRPAGDDRQDGPAERALVQGRARRRALPGRAWRAAPTAFNLAQLARHISNKVVEWPIAAVVYPVVGFLGWHLAYRFADHPLLFVLAIAFPSISLGLTIWVGGIVTQDLVESLTPYLPKSVNVARTTLPAKFWGTFRCQTYWLLATRGAWRVLLALARTGRFEPAKTDRVTLS